MRKMMFSIWNQGAKITLQILVGVGLDFFHLFIKKQIMKKWLSILITLLLNRNYALSLIKCKQIVK